MKLSKVVAIPSLALAAGSMSGSEQRAEEHAAQQVVAEAEALTREEGLSHGHLSRTAG
jgi:type II secretory pathway pseudopilin PulG